MPEKISLTAFDLDGTLSVSKQSVTPEMGVLLTQLLQRMPVAVMSGASLFQFQKQFLHALPEDAPLEKLYLFPVSAAQCYTWDGGVWLPRYDYSFSEEERQEIKDALAEALIESPYPPAPQVWGEQLEDRGAQFTFSALGQATPVEAKRAWNEQYEPIRVALRDTLARLLPHYTVATGGLTSIDITKKDINKAYGVRQLVEMTGVPISEMLYVGDALEPGGNDAVVIPTGIHTFKVSGPEETSSLIEKIVG